MKILLAQINPVIGALTPNANKMIQAIEQGKKRGADLVLFPELSLTGYPPQDLLLIPDFIEGVQTQLQNIIESTQDIIAIVGLPRLNPDQKEKPLFNSAAIIQNKKLLGFQDKSLLPTYDVFSERRYFEPASQIKTWCLKNKNIAITICEDIWQHSALLKEAIYRKNPVEELDKLKPDMILNLSASPFSLMKLSSRLKVCSHAARTLSCPLIYCNQVGGNDSLIFDGYSLYMNDQGELLQLAAGFQEDLLLIDTDLPQKPINIHLEDEKELYHALVLGVKDYF